MDRSLLQYTLWATYKQKVQVKNNLLFDQTNLLVLHNNNNKQQQQLLQQNVAVITKALKLGQIKFNSLPVLYKLGTKIRCFRAGPKTTALHMQTTHLTISQASRWPQLHQQIFSFLCLLIKSSQWTAYGPNTWPKPFFFIYFFKL